MALPQTSLARTDTQTVSIPTPADELYTFLSDIRNLPVWAVGFARSVRQQEGRWIVTTSSGEIEVELQVNEPARTIDFVLMPARDVRVVAYSRVLANGPGSEFIFTQIQAPGMPDDVFDGQIEALTEEMHVLRSVMRARHACAT